MKMHAVYDRKGKIIAANIPSPGQPGYLGIRFANHAPHVPPHMMIKVENDYMEGVFDLPDELTVLTSPELTRMMEHVTVDMKAKKLLVVKK
jgi:hypothetical protein